MHLINETMSGSAMQASAHAVQAWKQARHSSMHLINASSKAGREPGWESAICLTTRGMGRSFRRAQCSRPYLDSTVHFKSNLLTVVRATGY